MPVPRANRQWFLQWPNRVRRWKMAAVKERQIQIVPPRSVGAIPGTFFDAGWPDTGSTTGATSESTRAAEAYSPLQCIGTKTEPGCWRSVISARKMALPYWFSTSTNDASVMPSFAASAGWISQKGSARCCDRRGLCPVRVMVCHWSRMRPVLRVKGYSGDVRDWWEGARRLRGLCGRG